MDTGPADRQHTMVDSTSDDRTVNNAARHQYRVLSDVEKELVQDFKDQGERFIKACKVLIMDRPDNGDVVREYRLAITHMEDAVMRAVRGVTA